MADEESQFAEFFEAATAGEKPFPYQRRLALDHRAQSTLMDIPTGLGKTDSVLAAWLWNRVGRRDPTWPRRLVYCLPMRVLVEQTRDRAILALQRLGLLAGEATVREERGKEVVESYVASVRDERPPEGWFRDRATDGRRIPVITLMGGEDEEDWDIYPEREAVIVGTQDMLLSRALNRGYSMSRARWPMQFGLLHTQCLWVFDEIQLMGPGLATTSQLEALRSLLGNRYDHGCRSVWMSATLQRDWLRTVDFDPASLGPPRGLEKDDKMNAEVKRRFEAKKHLERAKAAMGEGDDLAKEIVAAHEMHKGLTLIVVNTVARACDLYSAINSLQGHRPAPIPKIRLVLLHSRFRPRDRALRIQELLADPPNEGTICVSTQVVEAGVDISATTLFTELASWASLVQRFGRCNRRGTENDKARVFLIDMPTAKVADVTPPYEREELTKARELLERCKNGVGSSGLPAVDMPYRHMHVIRRKDLVDLFDTTPDLAGNDIDIDRFIREVEDSDVRVFWRAWQQPNGQEAPPEDGSRPRREELCPAPIGAFRDFAKEHAGKVWRWSFLDGEWKEVNASGIASGQVFLIHSDAGGYTPERGWDAESNTRVEPADGPNKHDATKPDANDEDASSHLGVWQTIAEHSEEVCRQIDITLTDLHISEAEAGALRAAARWHDRGKAHVVFQKALPDDAPHHASPWAKAVGIWKRYERRHFRHELASALAVLDSRNGKVPDDSRDLIAHLVAAHHGKVRFSIRSLPGERRPEPRQDDHGEERRFARGVWDGDVLPATELGGGIAAPAATLSLEPMELGLCQEEPFKGQQSWADRMIQLRDAYGPFRLAYLEALLRAADWRASAAAVVREGPSLKGVTHA